MELDIKANRDANECVFTLEGEIDVYTAPRLKEALVEQVEAGCLYMILDMNKVSFIDSSGLGVLVGTLRRLKEHSGAMRLVCTRENILKIFRITGLDRVFPIFASVEEAGGF